MALLAICGRLSGSKSGTAQRRAGKNAPRPSPVQVRSFAGSRGESAMAGAFPPQRSIAHVIMEACAIGYSAPRTQTIGGSAGPRRSMPVQAGG